MYTLVIHCHFTLIHPKGFINQNLSYAASEVTTPSSQAARGPPGIQMLTNMGLWRGKVRSKTADVPTEKTELTKLLVMSKY